MFFQCGSPDKVDAVRTGPAWRRPVVRPQNLFDEPAVSEVTDHENRHPEQKEQHFFLLMQYA